MAEKARHDCSPQSGNAHILDYELFAEVSTRFLRVEQVPTPLMTEIYYRLRRSVIEDSVVRPDKLATLLNAGVEDKLVIGEGTRQYKMLIKVS